MTATTVPVFRGPPVPVPRENRLSLDVLGPPAFAFAVYGLPKPQGSHKYTGHHNKTTKSGKVARVPLILDVSGPALEEWREDVARAALARLPYQWEVLDCPLVMDLVVSLPRHQSTPKTLRTVPHTKPDLSKLARAAEDGIGTTAPAGVKVRGGARIGGRKIIAEDSRIVAYRRLGKVWERDPCDTDSLPQPGAVIRLWRYPGMLLGKPADVAAYLEGMTGRG